LPRTADREQQASVHQAVAGHVAHHLHDLEEKDRAGGQQRGRDDARDRRVNAAPEEGRSENRDSAEERGDKEGAEVSRDGARRE
jgi:hypothetical protein